MGRIEEGKRREVLVRKARSLLQGACVMRRYRSAAAAVAFWEALAMAGACRRAAMEMRAC